MEGKPGQESEFIPESGTIVELSDSIPPEAKEHLREFPTAIEGKYLSYGVRLEKGEWFAFIGPYSELPNAWKQFNPNNFPYEDGPYKALVKVPVAAVKPIDLSQSAKIYQFPR